MLFGEVASRRVEGKNNFFLMREFSVCHKNKKFFHYFVSSSPRHLFQDNFRNR